MESPELSVVVLGYRAGPALGSLVRRIEEALEDLGVTRELILVVNTWPGSSDPTPAVAERLAAADPRRRVVALEKRGGMGWDMKSGFAAARGTFVAVIDGDGQMPGEDVARVFALARGQGVEFAKTYRARREDGGDRRLLSAGFNLLFRVLFPGPRIRDVNGKPKVIRRAALERMRLETDDWFIDAELVLEARRLGLRMAEVPTVFHRLESRASFVRWTTIAEFLRNLSRFRWRRWRRRP